MRRVLGTACAAVVACSQPAGQTTLVAVPPQPPADASIASDAPSDAAIDDARVPEESSASEDGSYRRLVLPRPLVLKPATPAASRCLPAEREAPVRSHEEARELAAIDRALRAKGYTPLALVSLQTHRPPQRVGDIVRGPDGERLMYIGRGSGCAPSPPPVAMTKSHEVIVFGPQFVAKTNRTIRFCDSSCYKGCGMPHVAYFGAEVPADAKLGQPQNLDVPIDTHISFQFDRGCTMP